MIRFLQRKWKLICRLVFAGLVLGLAASWIFGSVYSAARNHPVALPQNLAVEQVTFPSKSGATIYGWLVESETNRGVVILQHGVHADKSTLVERARFLSQAGYAVFLFDFQAHGESIGKQITFGFLESHDSQAAVEFVKRRFPGKPIGVKMCIRDRIMENAAVASPALRHNAFIVWAIGGSKTCRVGKSETNWKWDG